MSRTTYSFEITTWAAQFLNNHVVMTICEFHCVLSIASSQFWKSATTPTYLRVISKQGWEWTRKLGSCQCGRKGGFLLENVVIAREQKRVSAYDSVLWIQQEDNCHPRVKHQSVGVVGDHDFFAFLWTSKSLCGKLKRFRRMTLRMEKLSNDIVTCLKES